MRGRSPSRSLTSSRRPRPTPPRSRAPAGSPHHSAPPAKNPGASTSWRSRRQQTWDASPNSWTPARSGYPAEGERRRKGVHSARQRGRSPRAPLTTTRLSRRSRCEYRWVPTPADGTATVSLISIGASYAQPGSLALTAQEEAEDGTGDASSLRCASEQDSRKGARHGREEASKVVSTDREEGTSNAQATEEGLARQIDTSGLDPVVVDTSGRCSC